MNRTAKWFRSVLALGLAVGAGVVLMVLLSSAQGLAQPGHAAQVGEGAAVASMGRAAPSPLRVSDDGPLGSGTSITGSTMTTDNCYQADPSEVVTQTLCFQVYNGSIDGEWIKGITLTLPDDPGPLGPWTAHACTFQDPTDSVGYLVNFNCTPSGQQVILSSADGDGFGEISAGASWALCVEVVVPTGYIGDRMILWDLLGDKGGNESDVIQIEQCTPLRLTPSQVIVEGCNGRAQTLEFELESYAPGPVTLEVIYDAPAADFAGPGLSSIQPGEVITFTAQLTPDRCLAPGDQVGASLTVREQGGGGPEDTAVISQTITEDTGWQRQVDSPVPTMDNVVIWANQGDGGLWSVGGYGSMGVAQRYDPATGEWLTFTNPLTPVIEYPVDGCYGLNADGDEVIVLFPDTIVTGSFQIFNVTDRNWYTETVPDPAYPAIGRWGQDIVSMIQHTGENVCYLSGGSTETGGGRTRDLWEFHPDGQPYTSKYLGTFYDSTSPYTRVFGFHASWYVPWVGVNGAICVAGGADHNHQIIDSTECYDLNTASFNLPNADLGPLPEPWWGMADGWQVYKGQHRIWMASGVAQDGTLLPTSAYADETTGGFVPGPQVPVGLYRLEGDAWEDTFYTLNGSRGGFWYSEFSYLLSPCPWCAEISLPLVLRE